MINQQIQEIEVNIKEAQQIVELGKAMERLRNNRDFKKVVMEGYFEKEAVRLVHLKADPAMQDEVRQKAILSQMDAIGNLNQYFETVFHRANLATKAIAADEETIDELRAEGIAE